MQKVKRISQPGEESHPAFSNYRLYIKSNDVYITTPNGIEINISEAESQAEALAMDSCVIPPPSVTKEEVDEFVSDLEKVAKAIVALYEEEAAMTIEEFNTGLAISIQSITQKGMSND